MTTYTNFTAMDTTDADEYLHRFLDEQADALQRYSASVSIPLEYTPDSLDAVWDATLPHLDWRHGYVPPALGQPGPAINSDQLEPAEALPSWFHHPSGAGYARFSASTLWLIDGAGRYFGEFLVRTMSAKWASGRSQVKNYLYRNQPVVTGVGLVPISPFQTCAVLSSRALRAGPERGPRTLRDVWGQLTQGSAQN